MGFDEGQIVFSSDNGTYYPGQMLTGRLEFELNKVKKFRGIYADIKGVCHVHWTTSHTRRVNDRTEHYTVTHESYEEYMNITIYLIGSKTGEQTLHPGHHVFPFGYQIPPHCPSSFEGSDGSIRYTVKVTVDRAFKLDQTKLAAFRVEAPLDLNANPYCKEPMVFQFDQTFCCWCMNSGGAETIVKLPAGGYIPKQIIPIEVACTNTSSVEIDTIRFTIKKQTTFEAECEPDTRSHENDIAVLKKGPIPGNTTRNWTVEMEVPDMEVANLNECRFINIDYMFKVSVETSGCHTDEDDSLPIFFGTIPLGSLQYPPNSTFENAQNTLGVTSYPAPPVVNQPLPNYTNGAPYPGANPPYPGANPPYPGANPPYPGANPPYPGANPPYLGANPPYPGANPPYPGANPPYPGANPPFPTNTPNIGFNAAENLPNPAVSPYPGPSPYPVSPNANVSPYPPGNTGGNPPFVTSQHVSSSAPYTANTGAHQPFSEQNLSNPPYPTSPNVGGNSPYPPQNTGSNLPSNSPYPPSNLPYTPGKPAVTGLKTGAIGFPGSNGSSETMPLLPPGVMPLPPSPFAAASAPAPATPDDELPDKRPAGKVTPPYPQ